MQLFRLPCVVFQCEGGKEEERILLGISVGLRLHITYLLLRPALPFHEIFHASLRMQKGKCVCMCVRGEECMTRTQEIHAKMHAPNEGSKHYRQRKQPTAAPLQKRCTKCMHRHSSPHPAPHPCNLCRAASLRRALGLSCRRGRHHGRGRCWDLGEGRLGCNRGREPGPW